MNSLLYSNPNRAIVFVINCLDNLIGDHIDLWKELDPPKYQTADILRLLPHNKNALSHIMEMILLGIRSPNDPAILYMRNCYELAVEASTLTNTPADTIAAKTLHILDKLYSSYIYLSRCLPSGQSTLSGQSEIVASHEALESISKVAYHVFYDSIFRCNWPVITDDKIVSAAIQYSSIQTYANQMHLVSVLFNHEDLYADLAVHIADSTYHPKNCAVLMHLSSQYI